MAGTVPELESSSGAIGGTMLSSESELSSPPVTDDDDSDFQPVSQNTDVDGHHKTSPTPKIDNEDDAAGGGNEPLEKNRSNPRTKDNGLSNNGSLANNTSLNTHGAQSQANVNGGGHAQIRNAAPKKLGGVGDLYPEGLRRLTRLGKNLYGVNSGPLADDNDWDSMSTPVIKEQLTMRGVKTTGTRAELIDRLQNWQTWKDEQTEHALELDHKPAFEFDPAKKGVAAGSAVSAKGRKWNNGVNEKTLAAAEKMKYEIMYLIRREDLDWGNDFNDGALIESATFLLLSESSFQYTVGISKKCTCTCPAQVSLLYVSCNTFKFSCVQKFNPSGHCKHVLCKLPMFSSPE